MNHRFYIHIVMILSILSFLSGCQTNRPSYAEDMETLTMEITPQNSEQAETFGLYRIGAGDQLDVLYHLTIGKENEDFAISVDDTVAVNFIHAPELNQVQDVRPDGMISMPYIGQVKASGRKVGELTTILQDEYASILRKPELYIVLSGFRKKIKDFKNDLNTTQRGLSRLVNVRLDGNASFPYLGEFQVVGRTLQAVNKELNQRYGSFLHGLSVDLSLERPAESLVYVLGEVNNPGAYSVKRPITAIEALTLAGGYKSSANLEQVVALRRSEEQVSARRIDLVKALTLQQQQYFLRPEDVVFVPKSALFANSEIAKQLTDFLFFRGWGFNLTWER